MDKNARAVSDRPYITDDTRKNVGAIIDRP